MPKLPLNENTRRCDQVQKLSLEPKKPFVKQCLLTTFNNKRHIQLLQTEIQRNRR